MQDSGRKPQSSVLSLLVTLATFVTDSRLVILLDRLLPHLRLPKPASGMYEVLDHDVRLELLDSSGRQAIYSKRQRVRFLQDNIIAFEDKAWGDGNIFAEYRCSPGVPADYYRDGHRYRVLISLRESKKRGEVEEFLIERKIECGFMRPTEDLQSEVDHKTDRLALTVIFPKERPPKRVVVIEQNENSPTQLGPGHVQILPDGRQQVKWSVDDPKRYEAYILRWDW